LAANAKPEHKPMKSPPAKTPEARENQIAALAYDAAEKQIRNGTASSQVLTHFLKMSSTKEKLERKLLEKNVELITAKTDALKSGKYVEELYKNALDAMRTYSGAKRGDEDDC